MFENNDDYDFAPSNSSKLASLFGISSSSKDKPNDSLVYKPPKQPSPKDSQKQSEANDSSKSKSSSVIVKVVKVWKAVDQGYQFIGQFGLALIGSSELNVYEIIGYNDKRNLIFRSTFNNLIFCNQKDNFSTFCDNDLQRWLVHFEGNDQLEFTKELEEHGAKVITSIEDQQHSDKQTPKPEVLPKPLVPPEKTDVQSDSSGSRKRADILNRMAKMGQQILPQVSSKTTSSDSDSELKHTVSNKRVPPRKFKRNIQEKPSPKEEIPQVTSENEMKILPMQTSTVSSCQNVPGTIMYPSPTGVDWFSNYILAQNTEMKINLAQISAKLDTVVSKGGSKMTEPDDNQLVSKVKALELRSDNLQDALQKSESRYLRLKEKYEKLIAEKQKEQHIEEKDNEIKELQATISKLTDKCEENQRSLNIYQNIAADLEYAKIKVKEYKETIETQKLKLEEFQGLCKQNEECKELQTTIDKLNSTIENLKLKQKDFDTYLKQNESEKQNRTKKNNENINHMSEVVKTYINDMYQSVLNDFDQDETFTFKEIQGILAKNLKNTTFKIIEECKDIFSESSNLFND